MKTILRVGLGCAGLFEVLVTLGIAFMPAKPGTDPPATVAAVESLQPWVTPIGLLAVLTVVAVFVVGRQWERMATYEKLVLVLPALAPLVLLRFLFLAAGVVASFCFTVVAILGALGLVAASGGLSGFTSSRGSVDGSGTVRDVYGHRLGSVDTATGDVRDKYGNRIGSVDDSGTVRDKYGNRVDPNG